MAEFRSLKKDEYLFKEGDLPDNMYIIRSGSLAVTKTKNNADVIIAEIAPGAIVGEMALFDSKPRSANVKALKDSEVVCLPYKGLETQLAQLPEWIRAIIRTLNQNLRDANQKIKQLGQTDKEEDRYSPQVINKLISILNFVGQSYGTQTPSGLQVPPGILRKYTIQIFQEPTNKMTALLAGLKALDYFDIQDLDDNKQILLNKKPKALFDFVEWYNDWAMKSESERMSLSADEAKMTQGIVQLAKKSGAVPSIQGKVKVNIEEICTKSTTDLGFNIKADFFNFLTAKGLCSEKILTDKGVTVEIILEDLDKMSQNFSFIQSLRPLLK